MRNSQSFQPNLPSVIEDSDHPTTPHSSSAGRLPNYVACTIRDQPKDLSDNLGSLAVNNVERLEDQEWYWGPVTKDEVNSILSREREGTFLVRDSSPRGCYTLTLRKGGFNKLIKIYHDEGRYGFSAPYQFESVVSLIEYYRRESLAVYNADLDLTLRFPAKRSMIPYEKKKEVLVELQRIDDTLARATDECEKMSHRLNQNTERAKLSKLKIDSYNAMISKYEESHKNLADNIERERKAGGPDHQRILANMQKVRMRTQNLRSQRDQLDLKLKRIYEDNRNTDAQLSELKEDIHRYRQLKESKIEYLRSKNITDGEIREYLVPVVEDDEENIYHLPELDLRDKYRTHCNQKSWYYPSYTRDQAIRELKGRKNGTFLIRDRDAHGPPHACSLVANNEVHHCLIQKTRDGYGFAEPFNLHSSLQDLVLHYAHNELTPHNEMLDTKLAIPVGDTSR